jgi:hypothetical protein
MTTWKTLLSAAGGAALVVWLVVQIGNFEARELRQRVANLQREKEELVLFAQRLSASRRVAQVSVQGQTPDAAGRPVTTLLWQEIGPNGVIAAPRKFEVLGTLVYFEAQVIKFAHQFVGEGDPNRSASVALFRRVFGNRQSPDSATPFDRTAPPRLEGTPEARATSAQLWDRFWELAENPALAEQYGVRVAQFEAPAAEVRTGQIWEITLDAAGGLNLRKMSERGAGGQPGA